MVLIIPEYSNGEIFVAIIYFITGIEVINAPRLGPTNDLSKMYLQQSNIDLTRDITNLHKNSVQMESAANIALV